MKKMLWIVNPHAGRGAMRGKLIDCILTFQEAGFDVTLHVTEGPEDATRVAQARAGEFDRIVCAGGDGTLNEVVTGLMQSKVQPPLGYIPAGTTNDFATSLGIPKVPAEAAAIAAKDRLQALDIGRFNSRYFNYIAAFGVFTEVSYATPQQTKNIFGRAAYIMQGVMSLANIKEYRIRVNSPEMQTEDHFIYGMVTNSVSVGGFKALSPDSIALDDGLYEVLLVYPVDNPMELQWLINDLLTHNTESTRFLYFRTSHITFDSDEEISWTLDGEFGGSETHAEIKNYARAIRFVTGGDECGRKQLIRNTDSRKRAGTPYRVPALVLSASERNQYRLQLPPFKCCFHGLRQERKFTCQRPRFALRIVLSERHEIIVSAIQQSSDILCGGCKRIIG